MKRGQVIEFVNGQRFTVVEMIEFENNRYIYVINLDNNRDIRFAQINDDKIDFVNDDNLYRKLMMKVFEKNKECFINGKH